MLNQSDWDEIWKLLITDEYRKSPKYGKNISDNLGLAFLSILKQYQNTKSLEVISRIFVVLSA
jgi:hypothetical protein